MSEILLRIKANSKKLPEKDIKYADKFILNRDWESLLEIVESDIIKHDRDLAGDIISYIRLIEPDYKYENDDIDESAYVGEDFDW